MGRCEVRLIVVLGIADRIDYTYYEAGYMMYVHGPSRERLMDDVRRFIGESIPSSPIFSPIYGRGTRYAALSRAFLNLPCAT